MWSDESIIFLTWRQSSRFQHRFCWFEVWPLSLQLFILMNNSCMTVVGGNTRWFTFSFDNMQQFLCNFDGNQAYVSFAVRNLSLTLHPKLCLRPQLLESRFGCEVSAFWFTSFTPSQSYKGHADTKANPHDPWILCLKVNQFTETEIWRYKNSLIHLIAQLHRQKAEFFTWKVEYIILPPFKWFKLILRTQITKAINKKQLHLMV